MPSRPRPSSCSLLSGNRWTAGAAACLLLLGVLSVLPSPAHARPGPPAIRDAVVLLNRLPVAAEAAPPYDRSRFEHWVRVRRCDTRARVLRAESTRPVRASNACTVVGGRWLSEYDGRWFTSPRDVEIDHRVALKEAWDSGAWRWSLERRRGFANDLGYRHSLLAVSMTSNRSKSDRDPGEWLPIVGRCSYAARWVAVKTRWQLSVDPVEKESLLLMLTHCPPDQRLVEAPGRGRELRVPGSRPAAAPVPFAAPATGSGAGSAVGPRGWRCPAAAPIKGNASSMIYHLPRGAFYSRTRPERCFRNQAEARRAGYRRSQR